MATPESDTASGGEEHASDRSLLRRLQAGNADAATQIYLRYARRLQALAKANVATDLAARVDADDIVQSVFRTFFRRAARGEYEVPEGEELWKLLLVIGLNKIRTVAAYHRAAKRDVGVSLGGGSLVMASDELPSGDETSLAILRMVIDETLAQLPATHRQILNLRIEGHEVADIAAQVTRSKRSVERILQELLHRLSSALQAHD
ncbi:MAG: hypothetical protein K1X74_08745 [Pirellulales bacterium]|nr:hypothetical protein [Pirellulales bacterium]